MKMRSRILLYLFSFFSLILLAGVSAQLLSYRAFKLYLYGSVREIFHSTAGMFVDSIARAEQLSVSILADQIVQKSLQFKEEEEKDFSWTKRRDILIDKLFLYKITSRYVKEILLVAADGTRYFVDTGAYDRAFSPDSHFRAIQDAAYLLKGKPYWSAVQSSLAPVVLSRQVNPIGDFNAPPLGILHLFIDIEELLKDSFSQMEHYGVVLSVYHQGDLLYSQLRGDTEAIRRGGKEQKFQKVQYRDKAYLAAGITTRDGVWEFLILIPTQKLFENLSRINRLFYLVYFVIFILFTVVIIRLSGLISSPIIILSQEMKKIVDRDMILYEPIQLSVHTSDEVHLLYSEFYQMIDRIDHLGNKNLKQQLALKQTQLEVLSNQLNPHFLYNTLDSLYWMAEINNQPEMASLVIALGSLLRSSLSKGESLITVKEQLDLLNDYFFIQKIRFKERLEYRIDADHQLYAVRIPRFTIQPMVENAIKYSLEEVRRDCLIEISLKKEEDPNRMTILIRDNGPGMAGQKKGTGSTGIGIENLERRITLIYGDEGCLSMNGNASGGTDIVISIPCEETCHIR